VIGIDEGHDIDAYLLMGIYKRIQESEFKPGLDHIEHVLKIEQMIVGKKPVSLVWYFLYYTVVVKIYEITIYFKSHVAAILVMFNIMPFYTVVIEKNYNIF